MKKIKNTDRGFYWLNKAAYSNVDREPEFCIGLYPDNGKNGTDGEMTITWTKLDANKSHPKLNCYFDYLTMLVSFKDVLEAFAKAMDQDGYLSEEQVRDVLLQCNFKDLTQYKNTDLDIALPPPQQHIIEVTCLKNNKGPVIRSYYYDQELPIPYTNSPGSITASLDSALQYLQKNGFNILSYCVGKRQEIYHIVTDTFKPIVNQ